MARAADPIQAREVATEILRTLRSAGFTAYFAGGCVRDALLGQHPTDYDIATDATPRAVQGLFRSTDLVGAAFGVVLVHGRATSPPPAARERITVEVATFRSDGVYTDARRPDTVRFSDPPSDAARRDFTINALFLDPLAEPGPDSPPHAGGRIIDYVNGVADLRAGIVRAVGDPEQRLAEDHLRALRAVRFSARLGFTLEVATAAAIRRHAADLRGVSRERIGDEVRRMLAHPGRVSAIGMLQQLALDGPVLGGPSGDCPIPTVSSLAEDPAPVSPMLAVAAWVLDRSGAARGGLSDDSVVQIKHQVRGALCLSNDEAQELSEVLLGHQRLVRAWDAAETARRKRWASGPWFAATLRLLQATHPEQADIVRRDTNILQTDGIGIAPAPLVTGDNLLAAGMAAGPAFRRILEAVYDAQLEGRVRTRAAAMELAARLYV